MQVIGLPRFGAPDAPEAKAPVEIARFRQAPDTATLIVAQNRFIDGLDDLYEEEISGARIASDVAAQTFIVAGSSQ